MYVRLNNFPTHLQYTENKKAPDKFVKLNNQSIYNGKITRFSRNVVIRQMHKYINKRLPKNVSITEFPIKPRFVFHTVINHGDISRRNENIIWKVPDKDYEPRWDIENLANIWTKPFMDSIVDSNIIPDDNIRYVTGISYEFVPVDNLEDSYLEVFLEK